MKRFLQRSALITILVSSLAILQGCTRADSEQEKIDPPVISQAEQSESRDRSDAERDPEPAILLEEDEDLIREILLLYGATYEETDEARMRTRKISLYFTDPWTEPEELPPGAYFSWFLTTVWEEKLTDQELEERYTLPDREGWAFPQDIYEERIQNRFDVSTDYLRSDEALYHPDAGVYWLGSGGGIGARPFVELQSVRREDDLLLLDVALEYEEEFTPDEAWQLTIQLEEDGGWKYRSWMRTDNAEKEDDEAERLAEEQVLLEAERNTAEEAAAEQTRQQTEAAAQQASTKKENDDSSQPSISNSTGPANQSSIDTGSDTVQGSREEPTSGEGKIQENRIGAVWEPDHGGWVYNDNLGERRLIGPNGATSMLDDPIILPGVE